MRNKTKLGIYTEDQQKGKVESLSRLGQRTSIEVQGPLIEWEAQQGTTNGISLTLLKELEQEKEKERKLIFISQLFEGVKDYSSFKKQSNSEQIIGKYN